MGLSPSHWNDLLESIDKEKCTPILGPEVYVKTIEKSPQLAGKTQEYPLAWTFKESYKKYPLASAFDDYYKLAKEKYGYPLEYSHHLARLAQFLAIKNKDELSPKVMLSSELEKLKAPNFKLEQNRNTPYAVLADLNLPLYITTNYDYFMEEALESRGKHPVSEFCRWNETLYKTAKDSGIRSIFDRDKEKYEPTWNVIELKYRPTTEEYKPTKYEPLVYHLHGIIEMPQSMVLTEKDYFDFVINMNKNDEKIALPYYIRTALATTGLLFIGYRLEDITFRVIFQGVMSFLGGTQRRYKNLTVQIPGSFPADSLQNVEDYLNDYIQNMFFKLYAYWGSLDDFIKELRQKLDEFRKEVRP